MFKNQGDKTTAKSWWFISLQTGMLLPGVSVVWAVLMAMGGAQALFPITILVGSATSVLVARIVRTRMVINGRSLELVDFAGSSCIDAATVLEVRVDKPGLWEPKLFVDIRQYTAIRVVQRNGNETWAWGSALLRRRDRDRLITAMRTWCTSNSVDFSEPRQLTSVLETA